jgi:hypothetical protein
MKQSLINATVFDESINRSYAEMEEVKVRQAAKDFQVHLLSHQPHIISRAKEHTPQTYVRMRLILILIFSD